MEVTRISANDFYRECKPIPGIDPIEQYDYAGKVQRRLEYRVRDGKIFRFIIRYDTRLANWKNEPMIMWIELNRDALEREASQAALLRACFENNESKATNIVKRIIARMNARYDRVKSKFDVAMNQGGA